MDPVLSYLKSSVNNAIVNHDEIGSLLDCISIQERQSAFIEAYREEARLFKELACPSQSYSKNEINRLLECVAVASATVEAKFIELEEVLKNKHKPCQNVNIRN